MSKVQKILVTLPGLCLFVLVGCSAFQDAIIPAYVEPVAAEYADADVPLFMPYTTLLDAKYVATKMDFVHSVGQLKYAYLKSNIDLNIAMSEEIKKMVFTPEGPIGLLLPTLLGGTLGAVLISKPGDKKKIVELEKNGKT